MRGAAQEVDRFKEQALRLRRLNESLRRTVAIFREQAGHSACPALHRLSLIFRLRFIPHKTRFTAQH